MKTPRSGLSGPKSKFSVEERLDMALAYINREIDSTQADAAMGNKSSVTAMGCALITAARLGIITIKKV